jgi:hypothetical protein
MQGLRGRVTTNTRAIEGAVDESQALTGHHDYSNGQSTRREGLLRRGQETESPSVKPQSDLMCSISKSPAVPSLTTSILKVVAPH